jgi:invasion protein IalB
MQLVISRNQSNGKPEVQADFIVPIAVHLPSGVQIATEKGKWLKVAYARCSPSACVASFKVDNALLKQLKSGSQLDVRFFMREDQPVGVAIDLKGFADAYDKLTQK